ncbi:pyruvate decarboxylase [Aspergillus ellipticus CBS 707.79]|uniref:Pyruvate decarboxylase n=1 Tax=Aspergillus ellipticus CBS 707.79 TaxID=1448320 RepID=A0A319DK58_9EURO|nr:pyruvate decarboxylase [Aspergillus ellipticus CBS 707.79]
MFEYLCLRIKEVGVRSIHGVPGDFNLTALDYVKKCGLQWVGNCNELNAGYAADGYARVNGISALMTIMGVGELSALNALAGSFAEFVPVIHIIGMPSSHAQRDRLCLHHTYGDGDFDVFWQMSASVSCMTVALDCPLTAPDLIDKAIEACSIRSQPVCLLIPADLIRAPVSMYPLTNDPLDLEIPQNDVSNETALVDAIMRQLALSQNSVLLVGGQYSVRHSSTGMGEEVLALVETLRIPVLTSASGKGIIDESHPLYAGLYVGSCSDHPVQDLIESADLIISIGNIQSDLATAGVSGRIDSSKMIDLQRDLTYVRGVLFANLYVKPILQMLVARKAKGTCSSFSGPMRRGVGEIILKETPKRTCGSWLGSIFLPAKSDPIRHDWLWPVLGSWLRNGDVILAEAGTTSFGIWKTTFASGTTFISQYLWASIGFTVGACQGAALAVRDSPNPHRRTILFVGDGSLQLGCQELSTMIRHGLKPIIFVICNNGYTIERLISGPDEAYHDIQPWDYCKLPAVFGARPNQYRSYQVRTKDQLRHLLAQKSFGDCPVLQVVELHIPQEDAPASLITVTQALKNCNKG